MIGLDSNIILRAITGDDSVHSPLARRFLTALSSRRPGVINPVVLIEIAWTLRARHKYSKHAILQRIEEFMRSNAYHIVDRDAVSEALGVCSLHPIDFADALIGEMNRGVGCETTMTFDQQASQTPAFTHLQ